MTDSGSQTGSQQRQTLSDATRLPATIAAAKRLTGRHQATSRDPSTVPSKQRVAGSNPAWRASLNAFLALYSPCPEAKQALRKNHGLVFASAAGTPMDDHNVGRQFRVITEAAGLGRTWVPRALRHTQCHCCLLIGVPVEAIALLAGHNQTATTELVYRHQIVPALTRGTEVMDQILG